MAHWSEFVNRFFSAKGVYRTNLHHKNDPEATVDKQVEMVAAAVPHYFNASGARKIELQLGQGTTDKSIPGAMGDNHFIENHNASLTMWFEASHVSQLPLLVVGSAKLIHLFTGRTLWHIAHSTRLCAESRAF